jgi:hypothetical protein
MTATIPADSITIDDDRAWLVLDKGRMADFTHDADRPCETCDRIRKLPRDNEPTIVRCTDCDSTGRFTFGVEVAGDVLDIEDGALRRYDGQAYRVHVVRVLPIVTWYAGGDMPWPCFEMEPDVEVVQRWQRPADAAPGKYAVELAVHA